ALVARGSGIGHAEVRVRDQPTGKNRARGEGHLDAHRSGAEASLLVAGREQERDPRGAREFRLAASGKLVTVVEGDVSEIRAGTGFSGNARLENRVGELVRLARTRPLLRERRRPGAPPPPLKRIDVLNDALLLVVGLLE